MKLANLDNPILSSWFDDNGRRLDSKPYLSGSIEAKALLTRLRVKKESLYKVTRGELNGIFNGPRFSRVYVDDPNYGIPFLGSTDILASDLSTLPLLSKNIVQHYPNLLLKEGWILITCSGTIGRMAYSRSDMIGMAGSQHFMRVVPDPDKILPGYLYAFLSSRFGVPQIIEGTYGAIIQHIEPSHIKDLKVPRLGKDIEEAVHGHIIEAARLRSEAINKLRTAGENINQHFGFPKKLTLSHRNFSVTTASSNTLAYRMVAAYYIAAAQESDRLISRVNKVDTLGKLISSVGETGRLKQVFAYEEYGIPFLTSSEIFRLDYKPTRFIAKYLLPGSEDWTVKEEDLLLARSGQVGGIIGRGVWADKRFQGACVSVDVLRLRANRNLIFPGYLFAYLFLTDVGYRQLIRIAVGSSIPHLSSTDVLYTNVPRTHDEVERAIHTLVQDAGILRAEAQTKEANARKIVETAIEEGTRWQKSSR